MGSEPSVTGAGEAAHRVGAGGLYPTVGRPIEVEVVRVTFIQLIAGGLVHGGVTVVAISTVLIHPAASNIVPTPVVVLVADSVAAVVRAGEPKARCVVGVLGCGEILGVEAQIVATPGPPGVDTVCIRLAVPLPLPAGVVRSAASFTTIILIVPSPPGVWTIILATYHGSLAVLILVTVSAIQRTGIVSSTAVLSAPAGSW